MSIFYEQSNYHINWLIHNKDYKTTYVIAAIIRIIVLEDNTVRNFQSIIFHQH